MATVEERVDSLESILGQFIVHTDVALQRMENDTRLLREEMLEFKQEMRASREQSRVEMLDFKQEMRESREQSRVEMLDFKQEMRESREQSQAEMLDFKQEMRESREQSQAVMLDFKQEMRESREQSQAVMLEFKGEMRSFKDEMQNDRIKLFRQLGDIANKMGTFAEDIVASNVCPIAERYFGCRDLEEFVTRRHRRKPGDLHRNREFDSMAIYPDKVVLVEVKSTPRIEYVNGFLKLLKEFPEYFPELTGRELIPIFASMSIPKGILDRLTRHRIFALAASGETMDLLNFQEINQAKN